jgi:hypothetical protein
MLCFYQVIIKITTKKYPSQPPTNTLTMNIRKLIHGALIVALTGLLNMNLASAADAPKNLQGTWVGTIGKAKVRLCLSKEGKQSSYYYEKYQKKIPLWVDTAEPLKILELDPTGSSDIRSDDSKVVAEIILTENKAHLKGSWSNGEGKSPVSLKRLKSKQTKIVNFSRVNDEIKYFGCELTFYEPLIKSFTSSARGDAQASDPEYDETTKDLIFHLTTKSDCCNFYDPTYHKFIASWIAAAVIGNYEIPSSKGEYFHERSLMIVGESDRYLVLQETFNAFYPGNAHPGFVEPSFVLDKRTLNENRLEATALMDEEMVGKIGQRLMEETDGPWDTNVIDEVGSVSIVTFNKQGIIASIEWLNHQSAFLLQGQVILIPWADAAPHLTSYGQKFMKDFTK